MRIISQVRRPLVAGVFGGAAVVAAGAAIAGPATIRELGGASPGSAATVTACIHNGNSQLRVVTSADACGGDVPVSWSAVIGGGLSGNVGDVYSAEQSSTVGVPDDGTTVRILRLTLPPGSYHVTAKTVLESEATDTTETFGVCMLDQPSSFVPLDSSGFRVTSNEPAATLALEAVVTSAVTTSVSLDCRNFSGDIEQPADFLQLAAVESKLTALVVGKVIHQG